MADSRLTQPGAPASPAKLAAQAAARPSTDSLQSLSGVHVITRIPAQPDDPDRRAFHAADSAAVARYWSTSLEQGLSVDEALRRFARLGPNKLDEGQPPSIWSRLLAQISDFTVLALIAAAVIAAVLAIVAPEPGAGFLGKFGDSIAIFLIVVINAILGLVQETRAEKALAALRDMTAPQARVVRGGNVVETASSDLVPGDVVLLEEGDKIAADLRLLQTFDLEVEEAALTGESMPVSKDATLVLEPAVALADRVNMAFMGTQVSRGRARGVVCNSGMHTELGAIAGMLARVEEEQTPLKQQLDKFGKQIVLGCIAISAVVFVFGWLVGGYHPREMFLVSVALAVAAIPEGLPAITTITLALGTSRMAKRKALVRRLPAVETLGCAQVICTDKTGTLTQNAMTVRRLWISGTTYAVGGEARETEGPIEPHEGEAGPDLKLAVRAASHASGARLTAGPGGRIEASGDPTDAALLVLARKGQSHEKIVIKTEVPFTSSRRMATVIALEDDKEVAYTRGAPEVIVDLSERIRDNGQVRPITAEDRKRIADVAAAWGKDAMRVLALAVREHPPLAPDPNQWESSLTFVGLVGIVDPPRPEVGPAIATARAAGIRTVMITGDHPATARAIAREIGLWEDKDMVVTGAELDEIDQQRLEAMISRVRVVARATAAHKLRVVEAFKAQGIICAMTGDGVNDAPAVKSAHIGVAMGKAGTEVTKEAADLVISDDNYATIVAAVEEGRSIYANIRKFIYFLLSSNAGIVLVVLLASLFGWHAPLTPIQILWINLITNGLPALALGVDPKETGQMLLPPRPSGGPLLVRNEWISLWGVGAVMAACAVAAFWFAGGPDGGADLARARTLVFAILSISPMFHALSCRSPTQSIFQLGLFTNRPLWGAFAVGVLLQGLAVYVPALQPVFKTANLPLSDVAWVLALAAVPLVIVEVVKIFLRRRPVAQPARA
jgi:P-type Ca2+ transporter type 2C